MSPIIDGTFDLNDTEKQNYFAVLYQCKFHHIQSSMKSKGNKDVSTMHISQHILISPVKKIPFHRMVSIDDGVFEYYQLVPFQVLGILVRLLI